MLMRHGLPGPATPIVERQRASLSHRAYRSMIYRETTFAKMHDDRRLLAYERACITKRSGIQFDRRGRLLFQKVVQLN
jgi:hypothetical protein